MWTATNQYRDISSIAIFFHDIYREWNFEYRSSLMLIGNPMRSIESNQVYPDDHEWRLKVISVTHFLIFWHLSITLERMNEWWFYLRVIKNDLKAGLRSVSPTRVDGPSSWPVNSGSGNRPLVLHNHTRQLKEDNERTKCWYGVREGSPVEVQWAD